MSKTTAQEEFDVNDIYDTEIGDEDYGFIVGPDGELKSVFTPEKPPLETPESILKILAMFGITDIESMEDGPTLH
jgi:hypothetical protein